MKVGRPRKIRMRKSLYRKVYGRRRRGIRRPKQVAAKNQRNRVRRRKGR